MDVIGDLVARDRRSDAVAFRLSRRAASYSYRTACTDAWKAGNLFRQYGLHAGATVGVEMSPASPHPLVAFLGASLLSATVEFDAHPAEASALVAPASSVETLGSSPGTQVFAYGAVPAATGVAHFERELWSETPVAPPEPVTPDAVALTTGRRSFTHRELLAAADTVAADVGLGADDEVALRAPLSRPGAVVAGLLAPLSVGATVLLDPEQVGTVGVGDGNVPEDRVVRPDAVFDGGAGGAT